MTLAVETRLSINRKQKGQKQEVAYWTYEEGSTQHTKLGTVPNQMHTPLGNGWLKLKLPNSPLLLDGASSFGPRGTGWTLEKTRPSSDLYLRTVHRLNAGLLRKQKSVTTRLWKRPEPLKEAAVLTSQPASFPDRK